MTCTLLDTILSTGIWGHHSCWGLKVQRWEEGAWAWELPEGCLAGRGSGLGRL